MWKKIGNFVKTVAAQFDTPTLQEEEKRRPDDSNQNPQTFPTEEEIKEVFYRVQKSKYKKRTSSISSSGCICGCRGRPLNTFNEGPNFDYNAYRECPARLRRKQQQAEIRKVAREREKIKNAKVREKKRQKEKEKKAKEKAKQKAEQIAAWIAQGSAGPPAKSQTEAKHRKLNTYIGKPCSLGHTERLTRNSECIICKSVASSLREAMKRGAYPIELNDEEKVRVVAIYEESRRLTKETGIEHHVDHIKPVSKGGTNHPDNLQILTAEENLKKSAKWEGE